MNKPSTCWSLPKHCMAPSALLRYPLWLPAPYHFLHSCPVISPTSSWLPAAFSVPRPSGECLPHTRHNRPKAAQAFSEDFATQWNRKKTLRCGVMTPCAPLAPASGLSLPNAYLR
jgi:hypothetical protein